MTPGLLQHLLLILNLRIDDIFVATFINIIISYDTVDHSSLLQHLFIKLNYYNITIICRLVPKKSSK